MGPPTYQVSRPTIASKQAEVFKYADGAEGAAGLSDIVQKAEKAAIADHGAFTVVLSGGSLINGLVPLAKLSSVDFSKWYVFYVDERNVPHSSADSNHKGAFDAFLSKVPIPAEQIFAIKECVPVAEAAADYEARLKTLPETLLPRTPSGEAVFDLILLGVGPDGHVASLFPGRSEIKVREGWVLPVTDSPKPPPERITFTLPVINSAKEVGVVAFGEGKADIVKEVLTNPAAGLPAQQVSPQGRLFWLLDDGSARLLDWQWQS